MYAFYYNVKENDKDLLVSGLFKHIGNGQDIPYNNAWSYLETNFLRSKV